MAKCTGRRCPMQVGYKDCHYRDVEETKNRRKFRSKNC